MEKLLNLTFPGGMNNMLDEHSLPLTSDKTAGQARRILNMDVLNDGTLEKRQGMTLAIPMVGVHSLWSCTAGTFFAGPDGIYRLNGLTPIKIYDGEPGKRVSYCLVNGVVYWSSLSAQGKITADYRHEDWAPGRYGDIVRHYNGRIYAVNGSNIFPTDPLDYNRIDPFRNFIGLPGDIGMLEAVNNGLFVGCDAGVYFLSGTDYSTFSLSRADDDVPVRGSGITLSGERYEVE